MRRIQTLTYCLCLLIATVTSVLADDFRPEGRRPNIRTSFTRQATTQPGPLEDLQPSTSAGDDIDAIVNKSIRHVGTDIALPGADPQGGAMTRPESAMRGEGESEQPLDQPRPVEQWVFSWSPPEISHHPLYFEEANLERHGYSSFGCLQPVASAAHFFVTVPFLPYKTTVRRPHEQIYTLGQYRPGSRVPYQINTPPIYLDAVAVQALAVAGGVFLIP